MNKREEIKPLLVPISLRDSEFSTLRVIRKKELQKLIPLSNSTLYDLEKQGSFPRRFFLTPRCVVWKLSEILDWLDEQQRKSDDSELGKEHFPNVYKREYRPVKAKSPLHK
uniref:Transcriptional regulator n=1 Tax=OCS116 cluster bacterium TaxID=2030921 RepID=A0A2A4Z0N6_9PROT